MSNTNQTNTVDGFKFHLVWKKITPSFFRRNTNKTSKTKNIFKAFRKSKSKKDEESCNNTITRVYERPTTNGMCGPIPWSYLPILASVIPMIGFCITYLVAKFNCHTEKWYFPYVSYIGTKFPELMYFGLLLNLEGFLGLITVFLAWRYYRHLGENGILNIFTLLIGTFCCFGVILVGNFPVSYAKVPHYFGAGLAFVLGTFYTILTAILSRKTSKINNSNLNRVKKCRIGLAVIMVISLIILIGFVMYKKLYLEYLLKPEEREIDWDRLKKLENGKCAEYSNKNKSIDLFGALIEWVQTIGILVCLFLYTYEFQTFNSVKIILKQRNGIVLNICEVENENFIGQEVNNDVTNENNDLVNEDNDVINQIRDVTDVERADILRTSSNLNQRESPLKIVTIT